MSIFKHHLFQNTVALTAIQIVNYVSPLIVLMHLTKILGIEVYGVVAFSMAIVFLSFVVMDFGYSLSGTNYISLNRSDVKLVSDLASAVLTIKFALFIPIATSILLYTFYSEKYSDYRIIFVFSLFPILIQSLIPVWFFQGVEKMRCITLYTVASKILFVLLIIFAVKGVEQYWMVPLANGISQSLALIVAFRMFYQLGYSLNVPTASQLKLALGINKGFFLSRISVACYMQAGTVLLGFFSTPALVSVYSLAEQLYKAMQASIYPVTQSLFPYMAKERNLAVYAKISAGLLSLVVTGAIIGYFVAPALVRSVFGSAWEESTPVLNVFLVAVVVHAGAVLAGYPLCAALGKLAIANKSVVVGALFYLVGFMIIYFMDSVAPVSIAILMVVTECYVFLHRAIGVTPALVCCIAKRSSFEPCLDTESI